jgi:hypothetical protein
MGMIKACPECGLPVIEITTEEQASRGEEHYIHGGPGLQVIMIDDIKTACIMRKPKDRV